MSSSKIMASSLDESVLSKTTVSLTVASWDNNSQTVTCNGVTKDNAVIISPTPECIKVYGKAGVKCNSQDTDNLTFVCNKIPESELSVNVIILGV